MHPRFALLVSVLAVFCLAVRPTPTQAQESLYTVSGVHVDTVAASSTEAFNAAIAQGRARAFQILYRRLTRQADWTRQPPLDSATLVRLGRGYSIANERRSTTRYVADVTYEFNPDAVGRVLRAAQIAFSQAPARRILVIPMSPGVVHGPWAQALASPAFHDSVVPFTLPAPEDDGDLAGLNFDAATWNDVSALAAKYHVGEVALAQALYGDGKLMVSLRRLGPGETPAKSSVEVPLLQTVGTTYPAAAQAAVHGIEDMWKSRSVLDFSQRGRLTADVRLESLAQWGELQSHLAGVSNVTGYTVTAIDMAYARIVITYVGGLEQLREALAGAGISLTSRGGGQWALASAAQ
jgi:hypothetical protein